MEKYSSNPNSNKWDKHKGKHFKPAKEPVTGVPQNKDISSGYEDYLVLLQERNRLLKKLKEKDSRQIELEKKEQGFSLYVNGANADLARILPPSTAKERTPSRQTKTADTYSLRRKQLEFELQWLEKEVGEVRAKTAPIPDQAPRREWQPDLVQIKTNKGSKLQLKAPGVLSGLYSEDFEATADHDDDDDDDENDVIDSYLNLSEDLELEDNSDDEDELTLSINDVETLRKSLEADQSIQENIKIAQERIRLEKETGKSQDESSDEDEIEEELEGASSSLNLAELDRLPHLTPITSSSVEVKEKTTPSTNKQSISFEIPINDEPEEKHVKPVQPVQPVSKEKTFVKESTPKEKQAKRTRIIGDEDMVVLSFSNPSKSKKERVLSSTRRKEDAKDIISSTPSKEKRSCSQPEDIRVKPNDNQVELTSSAQKPRARTLSSSSKKKSNEQLTKMDDNADEIFKAMALENQNIDVTSGCKTAPENRTDNATRSDKDYDGQRPASIASTKEKTISRVTQKVRGMDPRQQQHLISLLSKLEVKGPPFKGSAPTTPTGRRGSPMKATVDYTSAQQSLNSEPDSNIATSVGTSLASSQGVHSVDSSYAGQQEDGIDVNIEIQSNWGHPNTLGITEVQFFSDAGSLITYNACDLSVSGYFGDQGLIANIANAKTKTNKPRYMWCCQFVPGSPVEIMFHLPVNQQSLSKIVIWNFNGGVRDLNMGIKDVRIFVGGILMWKGTIDKGCGNQVFDYSTVINLHEGQMSVSSSLSVQPPVRSETVVLKKSYEETKQSVGDLPVIDKPVVEKSLKMSRSKDVSMSSSISKQKPSSPSPSPGCSFLSRTPDNKGRGSFAESLSKKLLDSAEGKLVTRSSSTPNLSSNTGTNIDIGEDHLRGDSAALPSKPPWLQSNKKPRSRSSSRSKSRPIWLSEEGADATSGSQKRSASSAETIARQSPDLVPGTTTKRCRSTGERSYSLPGKRNEWPENFASRKENLPTCLDSNNSTTLTENKRAESRHTRHKAPSPIPSSQPPDRVEQPYLSGDPEPNKSSLSKRQQWRMEQSLNLEESWNVLSMFEKSHKGRITNNMDLQNQDDALDQFLSSDVNKQEPRKDVQQKDQTDYRPMDEGVIRTSQEIPTLPKGKQLVINILSTWGDKHYVGLNGIEIFTEYGKPAQIQEITADPLDINILPDYGSDPRVVTNLVDGIFRTRDDMHLWMAPFTPRENHYIYITFTEPIKIAMLRIWNYNKSRIHSYRGAKDIEITLDNELIFEGEIQRASGTLGQDESFGDTILFTMDEEILDAMSLYDQTYEIPEDEDSLIYSQDYERPSTADRADNDQGDDDDRPFTQARQRRTTDEDDESTGQDDEVEVEETADDGIPYGQVLELCFVATWGDLHYMGLTGLELFGPNMELIPIEFDRMEAHPRDLNDLPNYDDDDRTLDKIIDGVNVTTSDEHMWLIPFTEGEDHTLTIGLRHKTQLLGMRIWNYNKSPNDTFRGAKLVHVKFDGRVLSPSQGFLIRKGPGNIYFDFAQDIYFVKSASSTLRHTETTMQEDQPHRRPESRVNIKKLVPDYEPTLMPTGFVFQFQLLSSWGDPYYIGLNGIQFYDENGYRIHLNDSNVTAHPHSVNVLDDVVDDVRTPDKLIDGVYDTNDGRHMWLAPIIPGQKNLIFVIFDEPVTVSMIKMWNYSKTPIRGVQQFVLLVDDLLVYHGILPQVPTSGAILPGLDLPVPHHTVLFTDREQIAMAERRNVVRSIEKEQDVQLTNDKRIVTHYADPKSAGKTANPALRPKTSVKSLSTKHKR